MIMVPLKVTAMSMWVVEHTLIVTATTLQLMLLLEVMSMEQAVVMKMSMYLDV